MIDAERAQEAISQQAALVLGLQAELAGELGEFPAGWNGAAGLVPAEGFVAGDCYDVFLLSPTQLGLVVLDIAGHGAAAAIAALKNKEILHAALLARTSPGEALALLAEDYADRDDFVSAFVASIDTRSGALIYANGGHPPAMLHSGRRFQRLTPTGPILSVLGGAWSTREGAIQPGEKLFAYTDGVIEARTADRLLYGTDRLERLLAANVGDDAHATVRRCLDDVASFSGGRQADDATAVCLVRSG